jgi:hypothetical protein
VLPLVLQLVLSGAHLPAVHLLPQHWESVVQAWLSLVQSVEPHDPPAHTKVQQSVGTEHALPPTLQPLLPLMGEAQTFSLGSQFVEQHSTLDVHEVPVGVHLFVLPSPLSPPLPSSTVPSSEDSALPSTTAI